MAEQFTANMSAQVEAVGMLLDAKHQLETQRLFQQKTARAHKDYHPSEQMCVFGTLSRELLSTERSSNLTRDALSQQILQREVGAGQSMGRTSTSDHLSRLSQYRRSFCDPNDNGGGLKDFCPSPPPIEQRNRDISYTLTVDQPLSLDIDLTDKTVTKDEEAIFALIDNLYSHAVIPRRSDNEMQDRRYQYQYSSMRSIIAMRGVARNSIAGIISLKTATPPGNTKGTVAPHLKALMREFGLQDDEINKLIGERPSYYAQMEILTKSIYQNPNFYTELYDKPTNVKRIRAAMQAIKLMQDRDIQASLLRREMLLSMIAEMRLRQRADEVYNTANDAFFENN